MIGLTVVTLMSYSRVVSVALALLGVGLQTLIFFHPSLSVIQKKKKKKSSSLFILETKEISIYILKQRKPCNFKRRF